MINENFIYVGFALSVLGGLSYLIETLRGNTKPNRVTWFFWAAAPLIAFAAELKQGVGLQAELTFMMGFNPLLIFIASFWNKKAYWKLHRVDYICGALALLGLVLWALSREPNIAILFGIAADLVACIPTVLKIWKAPKTESIWIYIAAPINATITLLTVRDWSFEVIGFPLYILITSTAIAILIKWRKSFLG